MTSGGNNNGVVGSASSHHPFRGYGSRHPGGGHRLAAVDRTFESHVAALEALHRAFERRDADGMKRLIHPAATLKLITATDRGVMRGREAISRYIEDISGRMIVATVHTVEPIGDGDLLAVGRMQRQGADNSLTDTVAVWLLRFREGLLWQAESFTDENAARERAALSASGGEGF